MVNNSSQNGSAHTVIIIGLVIALVGSLGFIFWQNFAATETGNDEKKVVTSKPLESEAQESREIFSIPEMDITIDVTDLSQSLRYSIERNDGILIAKLGTVETQDQCQDGYLGSIIKVEGEIPEGMGPQHTQIENGKTLEKLLKQYDGYYLRHAGAQNPCELNDGSLFPQKDLAIEVGRAVKDLSVE